VKDKFRNYENPESKTVSYFMIISDKFHYCLGKKSFSSPNIFIVA